MCALHSVAFNLTSKGIYGVAVDISRWYAEKEITQIARSNEWI